MIELVRRAVPGGAEALARAGVHPVLARIFASRGVDHPDLLDASLSRLPSFGSMLGIGPAAQRIARAIVGAERIVVVADYDADGATACAVAVRGLRALGGNVGFVVPNRFEYGYGLTPEIVAEAAAQSPRVIVTVDNGIASHEGVAEAARLGIEVVITDHHLPGPTLPAPAWIVDPNQPGCTFPTRHLAGVGVMFYVLSAIRAVLRAWGKLPMPEPKLAALLDLVALGTVADVVRLDAINRTLVSQGLRRIRAGQGQPGVRALIAVAQRDPARATAYDLGYVAGPRLNAAGRLADMSLGIRCLLADDPGEAQDMATELDRLNRERRELEAGMHDAALAALTMREALERSAGSAFTVCLHRADFHPGVVGIVASRLKEALHRPAIVFAAGPHGELRGSGRSIAGFHLRDALDRVAKRTEGAVLRFGGHAFAAGVSVVPTKLAEFAAAFEAVARELLTPAHLRRVIETDGSLAPGELDFPLARALEAEVWGQGFPAPLFDDAFEVLNQQPLGRHRRLILAREGRRLEAIAFDQPDALPERVHGVYRPECHEWQGTFALRLVLEHWVALS